MSQEAINNHETVESMDWSKFEDIPDLQSVTASTEADEEEETTGSIQSPKTRLKTVHDLFQQNKCTPPQAKLSDRPIHAIAVEWNSLASRHEWSTLTGIQKVKAAFLLLKKQPELVQKDPNCIFQNLIDAVMDPESAFGKRLDAFVRKKGDEEDSGDSGHSKFADFLQRHPEWGTEKSETKVTLFDEGVKPFLRYQRQDSTICYAVVVANAIYYLGELQRVKKRTSSSDDVVEKEPKYKHINVCRYMRNRFSPKEIFSNIFRGDGGHLEPHAKRLLQEQNPDKKVVHEFPIFLGKAHTLFDLFSETLQTNGAYMIEGLKVTQELIDSDDLLFRAPWHEEQSAQFLNPNHAVLVVGARLVNGDLEFLIQNSWEHKPFFVVSLTTLKSMGIRHLYGIEETVCFSPCELVRFEEEPFLGSLTSGSPRRVVFYDEEAPKRVDNHKRSSKQQQNGIPEGYFTIYARRGGSIRS